MSFLLNLLATYNTLTVFISQKCTEAASWMRRALGPEPQNWILLQDGRIISSTVTLPTQVRDTAYLFDINSNHVTKMDNAVPGRHRPLSILALQIQHTDVGSIDISDWVGELRMFPQRDITPRQLVELWGISQNRFVPIEDARAVVTRDDGTVETVALS
jgi:hypothetical protein